MAANRSTPRFVDRLYGNATSTLLCAVPIALLAGCIDSEPVTSQLASASTVADYTSSSGCSTSVVLGLSRQISDEIACEHPGGLVAFSPGGNLTITNNSVLPYVAEDARSDLEAEAENHSVEVNSAFRTIASQYLLYRWYVNGRCGISAAATVGHSNHESGRAVDLANWSSVTSSMAANGWAHDVPGDSVHFDHTSSPDIRGQDVLAFQKLWNRNNAGDQISEDGSYGPQTEARLRASPATGFAIGSSCGESSAAIANVVSVDGPDIAPAQTQQHFTLTVQNGSATDWPETAVLVAPATTQLHDASWIDGTQITALGAAIPAGGMGTITFDVTTPATTAELAIFEQLVLSDGSTTLGTVNLALTVVPQQQGGQGSGQTGQDPPQQSGDGGDKYDAELTAGCNAGGSGSFGGLVLVLGLVVRRRRR